MPSIIMREKNDMPNSNLVLSAESVCKIIADVFCFIEKYLEIRKENIIFAPRSEAH